MHTLLSYFLLHSRSLPSDLSPIVHPNKGNFLGCWQILINKRRFQENVHVFKVLEGTVPASVESRIVEHLSCLSAQQAFILRVMSVVGTEEIEIELLEVRVLHIDDTRHRPAQHERRMK